MSLRYFEYPEPFPLESGDILPGFTLAYQIGGNESKLNDKTIWICHALTGNSDVPDWWGGLWEDQPLFDWGEYAWVSANMLGSCYGSTYALSPKSESGDPWFYDFPLLTNRDIVRAFDLLRRELGIKKIHTLIGGSMGGQQALEWAIMQPDSIEHFIPVATNAAHSPWGIAFNEAQRMAITADGNWGKKRADAGLKGLEAARAMGMISYRAYETFSLTQTDEPPYGIDDFRAASYQRYQGQKLAKRFDAFAYWTLSKAMDNHQIARGRERAEEVLAGIKAKTLVISVDSDILFPPSEQQFIQQHIPNAQLATLSSPYGHDGFLVEMDQLKQAIWNWQGSLGEK